VAYGRPLLIVFNSGVPRNIHFWRYELNYIILYTGGAYTVLIINMHHEWVALNDADNEMNYAVL